jgi:phosphatidylglycerol:prolipoprotein diacylglycerol transferase
LVQIQPPQPNFEIYVIVIPSLFFYSFPFLNIRPYGFFLLLGLSLFSYFFVSRGKSRLNINTASLFDVVLIGLLSAIIGGRLFYLLEISSALFSTTNSFDVQSGGLSIIGALIVVPISLYFYSWVRRISFLRLLDEICLYAPILDIFGRLGCLFAGCCYGALQESSWSIMYCSDNFLAPQNVQLLPIQFLFAVAFFVVLGILQGVGVMLERSGKYNSGIISGIYFFSAAAIRFVLDFWRGDRLPSWYLGVTGYQFLSLGILVISGIFFSYRLYSKQKI